MKEMALNVFAALLLVTNVAYGQGLNDNSKDPSYSKTVGFLNNISIVPGKTIKETVAVDTKRGQLLEQSQPKEGGVHSGGGTLVYTSRGVGLLDLYLYNQQAFLSTEKGHVLFESRAFKKFGIDRLGIQNKALFEKTLQQIEKWEKSSPIVTETLRQALVGLPMYYVNYQLGFGDQLAYVPAGSHLKPENMRLAAFYLADFGFFVDKKAFDSLSERNQMGLLIHEALRHEQLSYQSGLTNENIQKLTATVLKDPQVGWSLDDPRFMTRRVQENLKEQAELEERALKIIDLYCSVFQSNCELDPKRLTTTNYTARTSSASELMGQGLVLNMITTLNLYRRIEKFDFQSNPTVKREFYELQEHLLIHFHDLQGKAIGEIFKGADRGKNLDLIKLLQGTGSIDIYLKWYNEDNGFIDGILLDMESSSKLKSFMKDMKAAGYFK